MTEKELCELKKQFWERISEMHKEHNAEFDRWYDMANFRDIEDLCRTGWMVEHYLDAILRAG